MVLSSERSRARSGSSGDRSGNTVTETADDGPTNFDGHYAPPGSDEEYLPAFEGCGLVPVSEFRKHPLSRNNPWARPHPDGVLRGVAYQTVDPYNELVERGAMYDGELVTVHDAHRTPQARISEVGRPPFEGKAVVSVSPFAEPKLVDIADLDPVPRYHRVGTSLADGIPAYYEREIEEKEQIADACPIDVYCSSTSPRWGWRWKLMSYYEARPSVRESCETLIIDSGFNRWGSPEDVLSAAARVDADYVMATDVTGMEKPDYKDHNDRMPDTAMEGLEMFMDRADELGIHDRVILPIQDPYLDFLDRVKERGWLDHVSYISIGGLLGVGSPEESVEILHDVRERVGPDMNIHALAPGTDMDVLEALHNNPGLVDSLDVSTLEQVPTKDRIPDASWSQHDHTMPRAKDSSTVRSAFTGALAVQLAHMLSPLCDFDRTRSIAEGDESEEEQKEAKNASLDDWAGS